MFGRQGAGKGTQSARLAKYFAVPHISTGEMLRNAVKQDSVVGRAAKTVLDRGELVEHSACLCRRLDDRTLLFSLQHS